MIFKKLQPKSKQFMQNALTRKKLKLKLKMYNILQTNKNIQMHKVNIISLAKINIFQEMVINIQNMRLLSL